MCTRALLVSVVLLTACGSEVVVLNSNNGGSKALTFGPVPSPLAMGGSFTIPVSRARAGEFECTRPGFSWQPSQYVQIGDSRTQCRFLGEDIRIRSLLVADCGGKCAATLSKDAFGGLAVVVDPKVEGPALLTVQAQMSDGTVLVDQLPLAFAAFEPLRLECPKAHFCPGGADAVFVGTQVDFRVRTMVSADAVATELGAVQVSQIGMAGIVSIADLREGDGQQIRITALAPGVATIQFHDLRRGRDYTLSRQVRVAAVSDAVRGEARMRADGAPVPATITTEAPQLVLTWVLADGTRAIGGAGRIQSTSGQVAVPGLDVFDGSEDLDHALFFVNADPGPVSLSATLGAARFALTYDHQWVAPALPACPASSGTARDLTARDAQLDTDFAVSVQVRVHQDVFVEMPYFDADVVIAQTCGPERVLPGPQADGFSVDFAVPGSYRFEKRGPDGKAHGGPIEIDVVP